MPVVHKLEVYNPSDELVAILDSAYNLQYNRRLNRPSEFSFTLDVNDDRATTAVLAGGQNYIKYYRGSQLAWSGQIIKYDVSLTSDDETISVQCGDWFYLLKDRMVTTTKTYSSENEGDILKDIIDYTQGLTDGDLGITHGTNSSTATRDRTYIDKNIQELFVDMSNIINGVDFEFTPARVLNIYDRKETDRTATHVFEYGVNVSSLSYSVDWTSLKNDLKGYGKDTLTRTADDTGSQSTYGLRQSIESFTSVVLQATLDKKLDDVLRTNASPIKTYDLALLPDCSPLFGTYEVGDKVKLKINKGVATIDQNVRIYGWNIGISNDGVEQIVLEISPVV